MITTGQSCIAEHLDALMREYPALLLGSYPTLHNPDCRVTLTLESKDPAYLDKALSPLISLLPSSAVARVE